MPASFLEVLSAPTPEKKKVAPLLSPTSWSKKEINLFGHKLLEKKESSESLCAINRKAAAFKAKAEPIKHAEGVGGCH